MMLRHNQLCQWVARKSPKSYPDLQEENIMKARREIIPSVTFNAVPDDVATHNILCHGAHTLMTCSNLCFKIICLYPFKFPKSQKKRLT